MLLVAFWCSLGLLFGLSWAAFWPLLGLLGCVMDSPGLLLDTSWAILEPSRACLGASWGNLALQQALLGASWPPSLSLLNPHMIASSLSRNFLGGFLGSFKAFQGLYL